MTTDSPLNDRTIAEKRDAFQADFKLAAAVGEGEDCLTPEQILALQRGEDLDLVVSEHLAHCGVCEALKHAINPKPEAEIRKSAGATAPA